MTTLPVLNIEPDTAAPVSNFWGLTSADFADRCASLNIRGTQHRSLASLYRQPFDTDTYDQPFFSRIASVVDHPNTPPITRQLDSPGPEGTTRKFTLSLPGVPDTAPASIPRGPLESESVLIPMVGRTGVQRHTLCVSSQIGCAMGCRFCQTAQMSLLRNLSAAEIVAQWHVAVHTLQTRPANIVFMGMGEPLDNYDNLIQAIRVLTDHKGAALPSSKITISTVGRVDRIQRLAEQVRQPGWHRLGLAVSLNAPNDEIRSQIMPVNRAHPMAALRQALQAWPIYSSCKLCIEYVLIPSVNDHPSHAKQVAAFVKDLPAMVNVIPYNPRDDSPWPAPDEADVDRFLQQLTDAGAYCKRRRTKGRDTMAACGQLGNPALRRQRTTSPLPT